MNLKMYLTFKFLIIGSTLCSSFIHHRLPPGVKVIGHESCFQEGLPVCHIMYSDGAKATKHQKECFCCISQLPDEISSESDRWSDQTNGSLSGDEQTGLRAVAELRHELLVDSYGQEHCRIVRADRSFGICPRWMCAVCSADFDQRRPVKRLRK